METVDTSVLWLTLYFLAAYTLGELMASVAFYYIRKKFEKGTRLQTLSLFKGLLERFAMLLGLVAGLPTIIIFFGAIKLGTRLKEHQDSLVSNDYFLIGNLTSVLFAVFEYLIYKWLC
jgi:hypothetical protein